MIESRWYMYGSFDGEPVVWTPGEAWVIREGSKAWSRTCLPRGDPPNPLSGEQFCTDGD
jgi:hypothetical protein